MKRPGKLGTPVPHCNLHTRSSMHATDGLTSSQRTLHCYSATGKISRNYEHKVWRSCGIYYTKYNQIHHSSQNRRRLHLTANGKTNNEIKKSTTFFLSQTQRQYVKIRMVSQCLINTTDTDIITIFSKRVAAQLYFFALRVGLFVIKQPTRI